MSDWRLTISAFMAGVSGPMDSPSPMTSSVTPCRMSLCERPSWSKLSFAHDNTLMNPGATASPRASITVAARAIGSSPTSATRSPTMATSARRPGAPVPSNTVPPRMSTSIERLAGVDWHPAASSAIADDVRRNSRRSMALSRALTSDSYPAVAPSSRTHGVLAGCARGQGG
jgi:hypothetical protein